MSGFVSWNICGLRKLARHPGVFSWLRAQKIILLQETLQVTRSFRFPGFVRFEVPAVDVRGKASGGLLILLAKDWLGSGKVEILLESSSLLLARVSWGNVGLLVGNVYIPIHSENCPSDIYTTTTAQLESVTSLYPNDGVIIGGDWNAHLLAPRAYSWVDKAMGKVQAELHAAGFRSFPVTQDPPTYRSALVSSTIDFMFHRQVTIAKEEVGMVFIALHKPIVAEFTIPHHTPADEKQLDTAQGLKLFMLQECVDLLFFHVLSNSLRSYLL